MGSFISRLSAIDLLTEKINFTYNKRENFPTICGGVMTILSVLVVLLFTIVLFWIRYFDEKFPKLQIYQTLNPNSTVFTVLTDSLIYYYKGDEYLFDESKFFNDTSVLREGWNNLTDLKNQFKTPFNIPFPKIRVEDKNTTYIHQKSVGIYYNRDTVELDESIMTLSMESISNNIKKPIKFSKCKRFSNFPSTDVTYYKLYNTYCVYDTYQLSVGNSLNNSYFQILVKKCDNNTSTITCKSQIDIDNYVDKTSILYFNDLRYFDYIETNPIKNRLEEKHIPLLSKYTKRWFFYSSLSELRDFKSLFNNENINNLLDHHYIPTVNKFFESFEKYSDIDKTVFALIFKGIENKEIVEKYYGNLYDLVGTAGGMFRIILLISGFLVGLISSIKFKEYMMNDFYSVIDEPKEKFVNRTFNDYLLCRFNHFKLITSPRISEISKIYHDDDFDNGLNTFFDEEKIKFIYGLFLNFSDKKYGGIWEKTNFDSKFREKLGYKLFYDIKLMSLSKCWKEILKYKIIYDLNKVTAYNSINFSFYEIIGMYIIPSICRTARFKKKVDIFHQSVEKIYQNVDFVNIIKTTKELGIFKNIFFTEDQNKLFKFSSKTPITTQDLNLINEPPKTLCLSKAAEIDSMKQKLKKLNEELKEKDDYNNHNSKKIVDYKRMIKFEDALTCITEKEGVSNFDLELMKFAKINYKDINDIINQKFYVARKEKDYYLEFDLVCELIADYHKNLQKNEKVESNSESNKSSEENINISIEMKDLEVKSKKEINEEEKGELEKESNPKNIYLNFDDENELQKIILENFNENQNIN